jgi:hypothetical protein
MHELSLTVSFSSTSALLHTHTEEHIQRFKQAYELCSKTTSHLSKPVKSSFVCDVNHVYCTQIVEIQDEPYKHNIQ